MEDDGGRQRNSGSDYGIFAAGILAGFIFAVVVFVKAFHLNPGHGVIEMTNVELWTLMLAAVSVILTTLGVIVAIGAFWGINGMRRATHDAKRGAEAVVKASLMEGGELHRLVRETVLTTSYRDTGMEESSEVEAEDEHPES